MKKAMWFVGNTIAVAFGLFATWFWVAVLAEFMGALK